MESNEDFDLAYSLIEHTSANVFLTGRAGTGKTTFLRALIGRSDKQIVVAAPTGIAAINAGGVTLHSLFQLDFGPFVPGRRRKQIRFNKKKLKMIRVMDVLVIDEISMVRADLLDAVDHKLRSLRDRHLPFGGVQLLLIGDLHQLPPVVTEDERPYLEKEYETPYFFSSHALAQTRLVTVELKQVYRQEDEHFLSLLADIRDGCPSAETVRELNRRYVPGFRPPHGEHWVHLTSHNATANSINAERLKALPGKEYTYTCRVSGNFPAGVFPAEEKLCLRPGAQVMFIKNDPEPDKRFFNGMLGTVSALTDGEVTVRPSDGSAEITTGPLSWENMTFSVDAQTGELVEHVDGVFSQIPLRPAWAITIHKSQGLTFDHAIIDASSCFAHGQAYVALSRMRTLEGMVLSAPIPSRAIISDLEVDGFMSAQAAARPDPAQVNEMERSYSKCLLDSLFDFSSDVRSLEDFHRNVADAYQGSTPSVVRDYGRCLERFKEEVAAPGAGFRNQYTRLLATPDSLPLLTQRLKAAAGYFPDKIQEMTDCIVSLPMDIDNAEAKKRLRNNRATLTESLAIKLNILRTMQDEPFSNEAFLKIKRRVILRIDNMIAGMTHPAGATGKKEKMPEEVRNTELFKALMLWRRNMAKEKNLKAFQITSTKALIQIANSAPRTEAALLAVHGIGKMTVAAYGADILRIVAGHSARK